MSDKSTPELPQSANQFNTVFISYGRQHSLAFARKLHNALLQNGFSAWFDMNDIPLGVDFQDQIDDGIRKADNFLFIISPHSIQSVYCYKELALALKYNKRIVPIMHVEPQHKADWEKIDPEIGRRNWVQMKQEHDTALAMSEKALELQNKILDTPEAAWKHIDNFDAAFSALLQLIENHKEYVHEHTLLLDKALAWHEMQHSSQQLLVGTDRSDAEAFLKQSHQPFRNPTGHLVNPPCLPTKLMADYVMESKKNSSNLQADLFICHDADDIKTVEPIRSALAQHGFSSWISNKDIEKGAEYTHAIHGGVVKSSNLLLFLSRRSLKSAYCQKEYNFALKYNKRIIPILIENLSDAEIQDSGFEGLAFLQHINFTDLTHTVKVEIRGREDVKADVEARREKTPFEISLDDVLNSLKTNNSYHEQHRIFLVQALRWKEKEQKPSFLLRGFNLENAQSWLRLNKTREQYPPLEVHNEFITASLAAKGQLGTEVFISYSRKDSDFARYLNEQLQQSGKTTWFDQESISEGVNFEKEIFKGIAAADNFVFIISPDSIESEYCEREVNYAAQLNKRFISVKLRETETDKMPEALRLINWIDFEDADFDKTFPKLIQAIEIDREHARQHTIMQQRASEWNDNQQANDFLLNAPACEKAEQWLEKAGYELPEIPHDLLVEEVHEKQEDEQKKNWVQRVVQLLLSTTKNHYVRVTLGTYGWLLFWLIGAFYFNVVIGEGFEDFNVAAIILLMLYLAAVPIWLYGETLPLELSLKKKSIRKRLLNFVIVFAGILPAGLIFSLLLDHREDWGLDSDVTIFNWVWLLGYFYAMFELNFLLRQKRKRQRRAAEGKLKTPTKFKRILKNVYIQIIVVYLLVKYVAMTDDYVLGILLFLVFYVLEFIPLRVFAYENIQEAPKEKEPRDMRKLVTDIALILLGWVVSLMIANHNNTPIDFVFDENVVVLFFDYFSLLFIVWALLKLKCWMKKKKKKPVFRTETVKELSNFYNASGTPKMPRVSQQQIDYIHESRTAISISKIELQIIQNRLQNRLRIAWVLILFMLLGVYSIFILSTDVKRMRTSSSHNLNHFLEKTALPYDSLITELTLTELNLIEIPEIVHQSASLEVLHIENCQLRSINDEIENMLMLKKLDLSNNQIEKLPEEIGRLAQLEFLGLTGNKLKKLPDEIEKCKSLTELQLGANNLKPFPKVIVKLQALKVLSIGSNELTILPPEIVKLENLEVLDLNGNELHDVPAFIGDFKNLKVLDLSVNGIEILPAEIGKLKNLEELKLEFNNLTELPKELFELKQLKSLNITGNVFSIEAVEELKANLPNTKIILEPS